MLGLFMGVNYEGFFLAQFMVLASHKMAPFHGLFGLVVVEVKTKATSHAHVVHAYLHACMLEHLS